LALSYSDNFFVDLHLHQEYFSAAF
jgi:hypothetical protein